VQSETPAPGVPQVPEEIAAAHPGVELHVVCDNYATLKHPAVKAWLEEMVEIFFGAVRCRRPLT